MSDHTRLQAVLVTLNPCRIVAFCVLNERVTKQFTDFLERDVLLTSCLTRSD